jgi:hypothetical protein
MSYTPDQLVRIASKYVKLAEDALSEDVANVDVEQPETFEEDYQKWLAMQEDHKDKEIGKKWLEDYRSQFFEPVEDHVPLEATAAEKKKLDPKAKVRNKPSPVVPASRAKDKKDHFPLGDKDQARNALASVMQYSKATPWWKGSLKGLQDAVRRKVKSKYPGIEVTTPGKKKSSSLVADLVSFAEEVSGSDFLAKTAQGAVKDQAQAANLTQSLIGSINAINIKQWSVEQVKQQANDFAMNGFRNFQSNLIGQEQYSQIVAASQAKMEQAQQAASTITIAPVEMVSKKAPEHKPIPFRQDVQTAQQKLNNLIMSGALNAKPLDPDGKLGGLTRGVLKAYKEQYMKVPSMTDEEAIKTVNAPRETQTPAGGSNQTWGVGGGGIVREVPF